MPIGEYNVRGQPVHHKDEVTIQVLRCCKCFLYFQLYDRLVLPEVWGMMRQKPENLL